MASGPQGRRPRRGSGSQEARKDFATVADEWLKRDQAHNRSRDEVERVLERDIKPALRGRLIGDIGRRDCLRVIDAIADRGAPTMARRAHAYLARLLRWAHGRGIIEVNPMLGLPKSDAEVQRDRVLDDAELARVWHAAEELGWPFGPAIQMLILTCARRDEISALRWREVEDAQIILEQTKSLKLHGIPLSGAARSILDGLPRIDSSEFVFSTTGTTPIRGWSRAKRLLDDRAGEMPPWRLHDLRRTGATGMQRLGIICRSSRPCWGTYPARGPAPSGSTSGTNLPMRSATRSTAGPRMLARWHPARNRTSFPCGVSFSRSHFGSLQTGAIGGRWSAGYLRRPDGP